VIPLAQSIGSFWMPPQGSTVSGEVDSIFTVIYWISVFFFALIIGLMAWFVVRYRSRHPGDEAAPSAHHNLGLEITWTAVPVIVSAVIFVLGFKSFMNIVTPPAGAYEIQVTGQKWQWFFTYPDGYVSNELHVPVDRPVTLVMTSEDVIHSLFIPAFRLKKDVVPGRYSKVWFEATTPGNYPVLCTEYCGTGHSDMHTTVTVHEPGMFDKWLQENSNLLATMPPAEAGEMLIRKRGCLQCHSLDGSPLVGPTLKNVFGHEVALRDGSRVVVDEDYVRQSILEPMAAIVAGFEPVMPTYAGKLKDQEISAIIAYLKTLSDQGEH
jgi:cytochrome c oxidase subunit II